MNTSDQNISSKAVGSASCGSAPKWAALVNDRLIPLPRRDLLVAVIKEQAEIPDNEFLVRDYDSPRDSVLRNEDKVDLAKGNVFYSRGACEVSPSASAETDAPAKLALFVNDRPEVTINPNQTGRTIRDLFGLEGETILMRDCESPQDEFVGPDDPAPFELGPVFVTRRQHVLLAITVNNKRFTEAEGVKHKMTGRQIASLVSDCPDRTEVFRLTKGEPTPVPLGTEIHVENCDEFRVIRNNVAGGYEPTRIERELKRLSDGGGRADFILTPFPAVIYRDVPARPGYRHLSKTDVMVLIPSGYPGQPLDGAHLPEGSPLLGRVAGSPQGVVLAEGRRWQLVSYHPHNGGGAAPWNKDKHGVHTYFDEVLCWIHRANN